jgi:hypothetical protein
VSEPWASEQLHAAYKLIARRATEMMILTDFIIKFGDPIGF